MKEVPRRRTVPFLLLLGLLAVPAPCASSPAPGPAPATLEDTYDREAGNTFQGAIGFVVFEGSYSAIPKNSYGLAIDDMTVEWSESHPVQQAPAAGCGGKTCLGGPRAGQLCFNNDDCGTGYACSGTTLAGTSCASLTWGTTSLYAGSGVVSLNLVDFNAETTQPPFDCTRYGFAAGCGGGSCTSSNDCDNDGLKEVEVQLKTPAETSPERSRLEQTAAGSSAYSALVAVSSALNAAGDGVAFIQYSGVLTPSVTALYFDWDAGAGDVNRDGTLDAPPGNGKDGCPGFCGADDDQDAGGPDKRPGRANVNDDGNGICDYRSSNIGAPCTVNANCPGGNCLNLDEIDELCGRVCAAGTSSGHCSAGATNAGTACVVGSATCTGAGASCVPDNCQTNSECGASCAGGSNPGADCRAGSGVCLGGGVCTVNGSCPGVCMVGGAPGGACSGSSDCPGGYCAGTARGDDNCALIDEPDEQCAVVAGRLASGIDDNCGCADNPITAVLSAVFDVADVIVKDFTFDDGVTADGVGDADGFADDNERVSVKLTLRNVSSFDLENVKARLTTQDPVIRCINDPVAGFGAINALQSATNGADKLIFTVGSVGRAAPTELKQATFTVTVTGTAILADGQKVPFEGTAAPQSFKVDLDLDVAGGAPPAATTTRTFEFENAAGFGNYTSDAAWAADWAHTWFENQPGLHCQYNDPANPGARTSPVGCFLRQDSGTALPDDWHLHSTVHAGGVPDGGRDGGAAGLLHGRHHEPLRRGDQPGRLLHVRRPVHGGRRLRRRRLHRGHGLSRQVRGRQDPGRAVHGRHDRLPGRLLGQPERPLLQQHRVLRPRARQVHEPRARHLHRPVSRIVRGSREGLHASRRARRPGRLRYDPPRQHLLRLVSPARAARPRQAGHRRPAAARFLAADGRERRAPVRQPGPGLLPRRRRRPGPRGPGRRRHAGARLPRRPRERRLVGEAPALVRGPGPAALPRGQLRLRSERRRQHRERSARKRQPHLPVHLRGHADRPLEHLLPRVHLGLLRRYAGSPLRSEPRPGGAVIHLLHRGRCRRRAGGPRRDRTRPLGRGQVRPVPLPRAQDLGPVPGQRDPVLVPELDDRLRRMLRRQSRRRLVPRRHPLQRPDRGPVHARGRSQDPARLELPGDELHEHRARLQRQQLGHAERRARQRSGRLHRRKRGGPVRKLQRGIEPRRRLPPLRPLRLHRGRDLPPGGLRRCAAAQSSSSTPTIPPDRPPATASG